MERFNIRIQCVKSLHPKRMTRGMPAQMHVSMHTIILSLSFTHLPTEPSNVQTTSISKWFRCPNQISNKYLRYWHVPTTISKNRQEPIQVFMSRGTLNLWVTKRCFPLMFNICLQPWTPKCSEIPWSKIQVLEFPNSIVILLQNFIPRNYQLTTLGTLLLLRTLQLMGLTCNIQMLDMSNGTK